MTVSVAAALVADPAILVTTTEKLPTSPVPAEPIEYDDKVAPLIEIPSFLH